jgi:hypothetical protein
MAESDTEKAHRLEKLRQKRREKAEHTSDTPEARAERHRQRATQDEDKVKERVGNGVIWS